MRRFVAGLLPAFILIFFTAGVLAQEHGAPKLDHDAKSPDVLRVASRLACDCGCPHIPVDVCTCGTAQRYRLEVAGFLDAGMSEDAAFDAMIEKYGAGLLREPPDTVAGIFAKRVLPILLAGLGIVVVGMVVVRWRKKDAGTEEEGAGGEAGEEAGDEYLDRVNRELEEM